MAHVLRGRRLGGIGALLLTLAALSSCGRQGSTGGQDMAPTIAPIFQGNMPTAAPLPTMIGATNLVPTPAGPDDEVVASRMGTDVRRVPIYDNELATDWSLEQSTALRYNLESRAFTSSQPYGIEVEPLYGEARLFFTVRQNAQQIFDTQQVLGVSLKVSGGPRGIGELDLMFTVMGSNTSTYWRANDTSVKAAGRITDNGTIFDEQALKYLDFNNGIPPNTWGEVVIWLDERILDPEYKYLTGIYILTDKRFTNPFYIDDVNLLIPAS